ncbi:hypothetical protein HLK59_35450, partial [Streptomyces sp. S3(2020)]|uniref:BTAD domain-containing putative transcriptional regulator n=1 Tax=Streptomyces sp. S3(2020) TaxID=2732044 RepID=UPI0014877D86|nr:hypothetical protein [Streptomyces sp. S3(2020)]
MAGRRGRAGSGSGTKTMMRFAVLGPVRVWRDDREVQLGPAQQRLLLALLVAHAGRPVAMDELVDALWGESPPASPANAVYRHIGVLRRLLEPGLPNRATGSLLIRDAGGYRLAADADSVDLLHFRDLLRRARAVGPEGALSLYGEALALRTGPVATGVPLEARSHPVFTALEREYLSAVKEAADAALALGATGPLLAVLHRAVADHPLDEQLQARLVRALAAFGQRAEALDAWQRARARLDEELGIAPGAELRAAQEEVLRDGDTAAPATAPRPATIAGSTRSERVPPRIPGQRHASDGPPGAEASTGIGTGTGTGLDESGRNDRRSTVRGLPGPDHRTAPADPHASARHQLAEPPTRPTPAGGPSPPPPPPPPHAPPPPPPPPP